LLASVALIVRLMVPGPDGVPLIVQFEIESGVGSDPAVIAQL
jgi:hypothetical protein